MGVYLYNTMLDNNGIQMITWEDNNREKQGAWRWIQWLQDMPKNKLLNYFRT